MRFCLDIFGLAKLFPFYSLRYAQATGACLLVGIIILENWVKLL